MAILIEEYTGAKRVELRIRKILNTRLNSVEENPDGLLYIFEIFQDSYFIRKVGSILIVSLKVRFVFLILRLKGVKNFRIGIYPSLDNPRVVYELDSPAELYIEENVLPRFGSGIKGWVKYLIKKVTRLNPSIAAVGIIIRN